MICGAFATIALAQDLPFLGIWTNSVTHCRVTVNVAHDFRTNGIVLVGMMIDSTNTPSGLPYRVVGTDTYEIVNGTIVLYGQSGRSPSIHHIPVARTTNFFTYDPKENVLVTLYKDRKPMGKIHRLTNK